jgi:hypothetical protein
MLAHALDEQTAGTRQSSAGRGICWLLGYRSLDLKVYSPRETRPASTIRRCRALARHASRAAPASEGVFAPVAANPRADPRVGLRAREVLRARRVGEKLVVVRPAECNFEKRQRFGVIFAVRASRQTGGWGRDGCRARGAPHPLRIESMSSAPDEESSPSSSAPPVSEPYGTALFNSPQSRPPLYQHGTGAAFNDHSQHPAQPKQRWPCEDRGRGNLHVLARARLRLGALHPAAEAAARRAVLVRGDLLGWVGAQRKIIERIFLEPEKRE